MKVFLSAAVAIAVLAVALGAYWLTQGPSEEDYADIKEPRITQKANERMVVVEAKGDPNVVGSRAFKALFQAYFKTPGVRRGAHQPAPRARWPVSLSVPREEWQGHYALPVPEQASAPPSETDGLHTSLETWQYGQVAEILHVGPYNTEQPDIQRLQSYVSDHRYRVVGDHEEEYVKGPGMFFRGNPDHYLTIIRLRVAPATP